ncbi:hypothetical protein D3C73_751590 [compost metagenome]
MDEVIGRVSRGGALSVVAMSQSGGWTQASGLNVRGDGFRGTPASPMPPRRGRHGHVLAVHGLDVDDTVWERRLFFSSLKQLQALANGE